MGQASRLRSPTWSRSSGSADSARLPAWARWSAFLLVALFGLLLRLPQLGVRPMHTDEAVNAYIVGEVLSGQPFRYDLRDRHGPMLTSLAVPLVRMQGAKAFSDLTESELRLTTVFAGTITILLFGTAVQMFGFVPCLIAALLFACAPLSVYYDRYFIHESIFVAATFGLIVTGWRAFTRPSPGQAALAGACAALMLACKETAVLHFFALGAAVLVFWFWNRHGERPGGSWWIKSALTGAAVFLLVGLILFSWFGSNWRGLSALVEAAPNFLARARGEGHQEPFWYYLRLVCGGWSGGLIFTVACIGFLQIVRRRIPTAYAFLALYAMFIVLIYSGIPYKTPWLALNFWLPIALFAGLAVDSFWRLSATYPAFRIAIRGSCILFGCVAAVLVAHDTQQRVFVGPADEANPYAYAHTSEDLLGLPVEIDRLARENGMSAPRIAVIASDPWPLPWYLRHYAEVGFWQPGQQPGQANLYITSTEAADQYGALLNGYRSEFFGVRPGVLTLLWSPAPK